MRRSKLLCPCMLVCSLFAIPTAFCQNSQSYLNDTGSPAYSVTIPVENGYIDISNGNLHLEFPLASPPQRGALKLNEKLVYDSRIWMFSSFGTHGSYHWWPYNVYGAPQFSGGWRLVTGAETGQLINQNVSSTSNPCYGNPDDPDLNPNGYDNTFTSEVSWTDPGGTNHPFNLTSTEEDNTCSYSKGEIDTYTTGGDGSATDGSGYSVTSDGNGNFFVRDGNGTQVYPQIIDRYGNYLSSDANGNVIDDTGRTPIIVTTNGNTTTYDVLAPNGPINNNGTRVRYTVTTAAVPVATNFAQSDVYEWDSPQNPGDQPLLTPVQSIQLPNGSQYTFGYDSYGELSSITLPTGGTIRYQYTNFVDSSNTANRWLSSRTVGNNPPMVFTPSIVATDLPPDSAR